MRPFKLAALAKIFLCILICQGTIHQNASAHAPCILAAHEARIATLAETLEPLRPILWIVGINVFAVGIRKLHTDMIISGLVLCRIGEGY